jgi:hypothetical protein
MSSCATQTFTAITQARFDCLVQKAQSQGITISGNSGEATRDSITIRWAFDPAAQTLELQCTSAPFFLTCGTINHEVHDIVDACP